MYILTHSLLLKSLGLTLLNSLWQMSLLWAGYHLLIRIFSNIPARGRHSLALLLLTVGMGWSVVSFITGYLTLESLPPGAGWLPALMPASGLEGLERSRRWLLDEALPWCSGLYLLVLFALLVGYFHHYLVSRRIVRTGLSKIAPEFRVFVESTARQMGIRPTVRVYLSTVAEVPVTLGFLKPVILVPVALVTHLSTFQVEAILVHELAHIRRKDYLLNLVITIMDLLFFFNPFARMLISRLKKEREHCCDDTVLEYRYDPHAYVSALLSLARHHRQGRLAVAATGGGNDQLLLQRARKILQQKQPGDRPGGRSLLLLFLAMALAPLTLHRNTPAPPGQQVMVRPALPPPPAPVKSETATVVLLNRVPVTIHYTSRLALHKPEHSPRHRPNSTGESLGQVLSDYATSFIPTADRSSDPEPVYADLVAVEKRDYSMGKPNPEPVRVQQPNKQQGNIFVPHSSFSFQLTDTLPPDEKLSMMEQVTAKSFQTQLARMQSAIRAQIGYLRREQANVRNAAAKANAAHLNDGTEREVQEFLDEQIKFQEAYLRSLEQLQRQLMTKGRHTTTVYI
jgi:Zn-dependent protease with chaperone function